MEFFKKNLFKKLPPIYLLIFILGCSFGAGKWNNIEEELKIAKDRENAKIIFSTKKKLEKEINNSKDILIPNTITNNNWNEQNFSPNNFIPHLEYKNKKKLIFRSNKIGKNKFNIKNIDFQPLISNGNIFFYDPNGTIFCYSLKKNKIIWKYNFYKKRFKNTPKDLNFSISNDNLVVSDNFGYIYNINKFYYLATDFYVGEL